MKAERKLPWQETAAEFGIDPIIVDPIATSVSLYKTITQLTQLRQDMMNGKELSEEQMDLLTAYLLSGLTEF